MSSPRDPRPVSPYRQLDEARIVATIAVLRARIAERFPGSGLVRVAEELHTLALEAAASLAYLRQPHWPLRIAVGFAIAIMLAGIVVIAAVVHLPGDIGGLSDIVQAVEAAINNLIFLFIAIYFLVKIESRRKRHRALESLHELRSVVHIVDMHQLTKDPEKLLTPTGDTPSSPVRTMSPGQLGRYLDYCSELLSLSAKVSAMYVQDFNDPVVLAAVKEIEDLTGSLSGKIWQKITLMQRAT